MVKKCKICKVPLEGFFYALIVSKLFGNSQSKINPELCSRCSSNIADRQDVPNLKIVAKFMRQLGASDDQVSEVESEAKSREITKEELQADLRSFCRTIEELNQDLVECENYKRDFIQAGNNKGAKRFEDVINKLNTSKERCEMTVAKLKDCLRHLGVSWDDINS